ncbi:MAG: ABC transporter permease subunit, partial [Deltaproteobacteria bacterium]|nr:ABC transporter permease subunit [Deltaproteobacteria bacterium]
MDQGFSLEEVIRYIPILLEFLPVTLGIFAGAAIIGCVAGILLALVRIHRLPGLRQLAALLVSYTRGTPVLVQLMLMYYVLPGFLVPFGLQGRDLPATGFVVAAYGLYMGANISEILRGAAAAVPRGQIEAAFSLGMS